MVVLLTKNRMPPCPCSLIISAWCGVVFFSAIFVFDKCILQQYDFVAIFWDCQTLQWNRNESLLV
uniref:Uncharacterized protein n=1 Tax=Arundo donax TaxID=35708 RepID=A0A0A9CF16_ARUDO